MCVFMVTAGWLGGTAMSATTEMIVTDRNSGLAIYGFDPVAYFTDRAPLSGREDLEFRHGGVAWRFRNEGNRAAFAKHPDVYMPRYGGYDPVAIAEGMARSGHPEFWAIHDQRLFLFYSPEARRTFETDPGRLIQRADEKWPQVIRTLSP